VRSAFAHYLTLGIYKRRAPETPEYLVTLDRQRRITASLKFLSRVADAGPSPEVVFGEPQIQDSVAVLSMATDAGTPVSIRRRAEAVVTRVKANSNDDVLRADCNRLIEALQSGTPQQEVAQQIARSAGTHENSMPSAQLASTPDAGAQ
jgi:hypothetical protein